MMLQMVVSTFCILMFIIECLAEPMKARLVNGTMAAGRLEMYYDGEWGTVCDDGFGKEDAQVACRMLGFNSTETAAISPEIYGHGSGHILLSYVSCSGDETSLEQCFNNYFYPTTCTHWEDVGVICNISDILLDNVRCSGAETSLAQCSHRGFYSHNCGHSEDVGVICNITEPMKARLVNGTLEAGRLEICFNGEWATVCDDVFGKEDARVACKMLGLNRCVHYEI